MIGTDLMSGEMIGMEQALKLQGLWCKLGRIRGTDTGKRSWLVGARRAHGAGCFPCLKNEFILASLKMGPARA